MQELITYIIVATAVAMAISKIFKKLVKKKKPAKKIDFQKTTLTMQQHNCSDCSAECMLRNAVKPFSEESNKDLCRKIEIKELQ